MQVTRRRQNRVEGEPHSAGSGLTRMLGLGGRTAAQHFGRFRLVRRAGNLAFASRTPGSDDEQASRLAR
jgi:hypothetical protein